MRYDPTGYFSWNDVFNIAAVATISSLAIIAIVGSCGTAAPPLLMAFGGVVGTSATMVTTVAAEVAFTGLLTMGAAVIGNLYEAASNSNYRGSSKHLKNGDRIDYEYYGNGNGNVHYDGTKGKEILWRLTDGVEKMYKASKAVEKILQTPPAKKALAKAIDTVLALAGAK